MSYTEKCVLLTGGLEVSFSIYFYWFFYIVTNSIFISIQNLAEKGPVQPSTPNPSSYCVPVSKMWQRHWPGGMWTITKPAGIHFKTVALRSIIILREMIFTLIVSGWISANILMVILVPAPLRQWLALVPDDKFNDSSFDLFFATSSINIIKQEHEC